MSDDATLREENAALRRRNTELEALLRNVLAQAESLASSVRGGLVESVPPEEQAAAAAQWLDPSSDEEAEAPASPAAAASCGIYGVPEPAVPRAGPLLAAPSATDNNPLLAMSATVPAAPAASTPPASLLQMPETSAVGATSTTAGGGGGGDLMGMKFPVAEPNLLGTFPPNPASPTGGGDLLASASSAGGVMGGGLMGGGLMVAGGALDDSLFTIEPEPAAE
eukprot:COSAG05_NODE_2532_length_2937_cov_3.695913_2_plen_223_part_00